MDARAYEMMAELEDRHWWWSGRRTILRSVLKGLYARPDAPRGVLYDLGCGVGSNIELLGEFGTAIGIDGATQAVDYAHARGRRNVHLADLSRGLAAVSGYAPGSGAVVLLADVIEHLDDEQPAMQLASHLLAPGGALIVTVPAFGFLWGPSDEFNHHRRRYTRDTLGAVLRTTFAIERISYFNFWLFPPIALARVLSKAAKRPGAEEIGLPPRPLNAGLQALLGSESKLLERRDLPFGVSLLAIGRKPR